EQTPPSLRGLVDNVPPTVEAAVMRALEKDPSARFQTVGAFSHALDTCLAELATAAPPQQQRQSSPAQQCAQTSSRTAVNPAIAYAQQLPGNAGPTANGRGIRHRLAVSMNIAARRLRSTAVWRKFHKLDRRAGVIALALPALATGTALVWPYLAPPARVAVPESTSPQQQIGNTVMPRALAIIRVHSTN